MISFIHSGGPMMASYRYRAEVPARELGASINDLSADVLVFAKPSPEDLQSAKKAIESGRTVIADFCDDHFATHPHYRELAEIAHAVVCPTKEMARRVPAFSYVIPDPYEFPEAEPHCNGDKALWFGHAVNWESLLRVLPDVEVPLKLVSNVAGAIPWSKEVMLREFSEADIVLLPATASYKSCNRALEAIRQGCFVVAEPHPSLTDIPGIWKGTIKEGIEWATQNTLQANEKTKQAQNHIRHAYSPKTVASAWKRLCETAKSRSVSVAENTSGLGGSMSISTSRLISSAT